MNNGIVKFAAGVLLGLAVGADIAYLYALPMMPEVQPSQAQPLASPTTQGPDEALISEWRGSAKGTVRALENGFITISNEDGKSLHAMLDEAVTVRRTTISGSQSTTQEATLTDLRVGQDVIVLVATREGMAVALDINIVEVASSSLVPTS